eukprot:365455-Chlamydomonas_euryale.AAC.13
MRRASRDLNSSRAPMYCPPPPLLPQQWRPPSSELAAELGALEAGRALEAPPTAGAAGRTHTLPFASASCTTSPSSGCTSYMPGSHASCTAWPGALPAPTGLPRTEPTASTSSSRDDARRHSGSCRAAAVSPWSRSKAPAGAAVCLQLCAVTHPVAEVQGCWLDMLAGLICSADRTACPSP